MASHDLHFTVQNSDGTQLEFSQEGEMDHLPERGGGNDSRQGTSLQYIQEKLAQSSHPVVIIFHILFKGLALFMYVFGGWFVNTKNGSSFITLTVMCILLLAADFWVVKNVTGRFLVGLRWWNKVENDSTTWIFESAEDKAINSFDRSVFWAVLYATPLIWVFLLFMGIMRIQLYWLLIVIIALALSISNVYGYYRCSKDQKARFQQMMQQGAQQGAMAMVRNNMLSMLTGQSSSGRNVV